MEFVYKKKEGIEKMNYNQERISALLEKITVDLYFKFGKKKSYEFTKKFKSFLFTNYDTHYVHLLRPNEEHEVICYLTGIDNLISVLKEESEKAKA